MTFAWKPTNAPLASSRTDDIWFVDDQTGWAVNSNGQVLFTQNGGDDWVVKHVFPPKTYLRCIAFPTASTGWIGALTGSHALYKSNDGGTTWSPIGNLPPTPDAICGMWAVNDSIFYGSGTNYPDRQAAVVKTTDGGATWTHIDMRQHASLLVDVYFLDERRGWVVGGAGGSARSKVKPVVLYTADGGVTWINQLAGQEELFPFGEWGWKIHFVDERVGYISLESFDKGAILKSEDGGMTWTRKAIDDPQRNANLEGIGFLNAEQGWVGGWGDRLFKGGYSSETSNGGGSWRDANHIGKFLNRFRVVGNPVRAIYASGDTVYKYADRSSRIESAVSVAVATKRLVLNEHAELVSGMLTIFIDIPEESGSLCVEAWNRFGAHLATLAEETKPQPGLRHVIWDFVGDDGRVAEDGHFIYRVNVDDKIESRIVFFSRSSLGHVRETLANVAPDDHVSTLEMRLSSQTAGGHALPALPTVEEEKEAFHRLANIEDFPDFRPTAMKLAKAYLDNVDYGADQLYAPFDYTPDAFDERMKKIYEAVLPGMHGPHRYDRDIVTWSNGKRYRIGRASDAVVRDRLLQLAPFNLMDGVWLQSILQARPSDEVQSRLFDIWADEAGNGKSRQNHSNVYEDLLRSQGIYLPPVTSRAFLGLDLAPGAWRSPVFQSAIGLFPQAFFPELIGMTLFLEWEATPTLQPAVRMLKNRGMNPLFYSLHVAIDNISEGHGAIAKQAVKIFLEEKLEQGGDRAVQENWKRIWNGYVGWATTGFNGQGLEERRLLIDKKSINLGTPEAPDCFPKWSTFHRDRMLRLVRSKAAFAAQVHGRKMLDGALLNDLFSRPEELLDKMVSSRLVNVEQPRRSRLFELLAYEGPMYRVFTDEEKEVVLDWIESISAKQEPCIDPLPDTPSERPWPEKMAELIVNYGRVGRRAHEKLTLPNDSGQPRDFVDYFDDPVEMMKGLVRGGWVIPGEPDRSMFLTRVLENAGPMDGVFDTDGVETVRQWILDGAQLPSTDPVKQSSGLESLPKENVSAFLERRSFIGQGSVH